MELVSVEILPSMTSTYSVVVALFKVNACYYAFFSPSNSFLYLTNPVYKNIAINRQEAKLKPRTDDQVFLDKFFLEKEPCSKAGHANF